MVSEPQGRPHAVATHLVSARRRARRRLLARVVTARDDERRRIARDLAEGPLRSMASIRARLERLAARLPTGAPQEEIERLLRDVDDVSGALRGMSSDLTVPPERDTLGADLQTFLTRLEHETGVGCALDVQLARVPDPRIATGCARIVRDAAAQAGRRGGATHIRVTVIGGDELLARVEHDGSAWDLPQDGTAEAAMRDRAEALGGRLEVRTVEGVRRVLELSVPAGRRPAALRGSGR